MKKIKILFLSMSFLLLSISPAFADIVLYDQAFNINGDVTGYGEIPAGMDDDDFDWTTNLGTLVYTTDESGFFLAFFDYEMTQEFNTFFNEYGVEVGSPAALQSWEIDEPGYVFGDIWDNFLDNTLDNFNNVPIDSPDDVAMAMGWNFSLADDQTAIITLILSDIAPDADFYLAHIDPLSQESIYFQGSLEIRGGGTPPPVPEPATMMLLGSGLVGLLGFRKRFNKK